MTIPPDRPELRPGPLAYMARHPVAANLLMLVFLVGGLVMTGQIRQEVFPDYTPHEIRIDLSYSGASPEDVEQAMLLPVEDAIQNVAGIQRSYGYASEGNGRVTVEVVRGMSPELVMNEIQTAIAGITTFPEDADRPRVSLRTSRVNVLTVIVYGAIDERSLREIAERTREGLLSQPEISRVALSGMRAPEISVEVDESTLRAHNLSLERIASAIRSAAVDVPGGGLRTPGGEILVRTSERKEHGRDFEDIIVVASPDGSTVRLGEIASVNDGFRDLNRLTFYNNRMAARLIVSRVGDQTPLEVAGAVHRYLSEYASTLPPGVEFAIWEDESEEFAERIDLLISNAYMGLALILLILGLFLNIRLAMWVTLGIPISFLGALIFMPLLGVSFNMISLFAFILCLCIVVDYAIVVGESIYKQREEGHDAMSASIRGVREVSGPLGISLLTTSLVFLPLLAVPGTMGNLFKVVPVVVVLVLVLSLVEALVILPSHLSRAKNTRATDDADGTFPDDSFPDAAHASVTTGADASCETPAAAAAAPGPPTLRQRLSALLARAIAVQKRFGDALDRFVEQQYRPALEYCMELRYVAIAAGLAALVVITALISSGRMSFDFFPPDEGDVAAVALRMPFGTHAEVTHRVADRILEAADEVIEEFGGEAIYRGVLTEHGIGASTAGATGDGSHLARLSVHLISADERDFTTAEFTERWRERVGEIPGVEALIFNYSSGLDSGPAVSINLFHPNPDMVERAASDLADTLRELRGVINVDSGVARGKEQLDIRLRPEARSLGLTEAALGRQLRSAFFGIEGVRMQRGRDELRVYVRRPLAERQSEDTIERMILLTPGGGEVPLSEAATIERSRGHVSISREGGRRITNVSAAVEPGVTTGNEVMAALRAGPLQDLQAAYPGLDWTVDGEQREQAEAISQLVFLLMLALFAIYLLLAFSFRSYIQPIIIMAVIPFGFIGAIFGHIVMGYSLSFMSVMGMIALSGLIINVSLLLISAANDFRPTSPTARDAMVTSACRRFRPIVLTAATTFIGLAPMLVETSTQAAFLVPMAISMGFGIVFGTVICLFFVPCTFMIFDDARHFLARRFGR